MDASETIDAMVQSADNPWGRRLHDALLQATSGRSGASFAVSPYIAVSHADLSPQAPDSPDLPDVGDSLLCGVLSKLEAANLVTTRTVLHESPSENHLTDGRIITAVEVHRPFAILSVDYWWTRLRANTCADRWEVTERSYIVPAGWYLVGEVGEHCYDLVGVAGMAGYSDDTFCWLYELEGFAASHCLAECDSCGSRWTADGGSWRFEPDWCGDAAAWSFDDAEDFDTNNTIACPNCGNGRVGFLIS